MIRIAITAKAKALEALASTLPLGSVPYFHRTTPTTARNPKGIGLKSPLEETEMLAWGT
jgi:hypothetical protein